VKKAIAIFVSVLFVFAIASLSFAVEKKAATAPAAVEKKEAAPVKAEEKKAPVVKVKRISGEVVAVDATAGTLTVKSKKQDVSFSTDDKTVVKKGIEKKILADVVAGDKVIVKYKEVDGKNVAKSIAVK
jgi:glucose dehydrogenase